VSEPKAAAAAFARTGLPTARTTLHARYAVVRLTCRSCRSWRHADLQKLIDEGWGDVPLIHLRWDCGHCGSHRIDMVVEAKRTGPRPTARPVRKLVPLDG
jgi:hypothetical protein